MPTLYYFVSGQSAPAPDGIHLSPLPTGTNQYLDLINIENETFRPRNEQIDARASALSGKRWMQLIAVKRTWPADLRFLPLSHKAGWEFIYTLTGPMYLVDDLNYPGSVTAIPVQFAKQAMEVTPMGEASGIEWRVTFALEEL